MCEFCKNQREIICPGCEGQHSGFFGCSCCGARGKISCPKCSDNRKNQK